MYYFDDEEWRTTMACKTNKSTRRKGCGGKGGK